MKRLQRAAVLLSLIEALRRRDSWCAETNVQKAVYFLQELLEVPLDLEFVLYKYGPYSFDLREELTSLRADSILTFEIRDPTYGPSYAPGQLRDLIVGDFPKTISRFRKEIDFVAERLGNKGIAELERLSTALYVRLRSPDTGVHKRAQSVRELKPHISSPLAEQAVKEVDAMFEEWQAICKE